MTRDYSKGLVYRLVYNHLTYYVGKTTNFTVRKNAHKSCCYNPNSCTYHLPIYKFIRENGTWEDWDMVLIEYFPCKTDLELGKRERHWFDEYKPSLLNINTPAQTDYECNVIYREKNRTLINEKKKINYKENIEQRKKYNDDNKVRIQSYNNSYNNSNKERTKTYNREYYKRNKARAILAIAEDEEENIC